MPAYVLGSPSASFGPESCVKSNDIGQLIRISSRVPDFTTIVRFGAVGCPSAVPHTWQPCTKWTIVRRRVGEATAAGTNVAPAARTTKSASLFTPAS